MIRDLFTHLRDLTVNRKSYWKIGLPVAALVIVAAALMFRQPAPAPLAGCPDEIGMTAPSGRTLALCETLFETQASGEVWAVIRVLDPSLSQARAVETGAVTDHDWACETWGLDAAMAEPGPTRIVVQIVAAMFPRGEAAPDIVQAIEAYSVDTGTCIWELL